MYNVFGLLQQYTELVCVVVGALVAWGCTELSRYFANSYQKQQTLNSTLSLLLELYFQIKRIQGIHSRVRDFTKWYIKLLEEKPISEEGREQLEIIMNQLITQMISDLASDDLLKLSSDYESAIEKLSCYYPVAAYRLRGRADIKSILLDIDTYYKKLKEQLPYETNEFDGLLISLQATMQPDIIQDNVVALREEIIVLATHIKWRQHKEMKTTLDNIDSSNNPTLDQYIDFVKHNLLEALNRAL